MQNQDKEEKPTSSHERRWEIIVVEAVTIAAVAAAIVFVLWVMVRFFQLMLVPLD